MAHRTAPRRRVGPRLAALLAFVLAAAALAGGARAADWRLLYRQGDLFAGPEAAPLAVERTEVPAGTPLRAGPAVAPADLAGLLERPPAAAAAVLLGPDRVATLSTGATLAPAGPDEAEAALTLGGAVHLLLAAPEGGEPVRLTLGPVTLETAGAHLFYNGWARPARLTLVAGEAALVQPPGAPPPAPEAPAPAPLRAGETLVLGAGPPGRETPTPEDERLRQWAELPGFGTAGPYNPVGVAVLPAEPLTVVRHGQPAELPGPRITVLEGDELRTRQGQRVLIRFDNGDRVRLYQATTFHIARHRSRPAERESVLFSLFGKVRALLTERTAPADLRFQTGTAVIGVKGTDFETLAAAGDTTVSVVEGLVGVTDPAGQGAVDVGAGMFTSVPAGQLPSPPQPLPPERLQELRAEGIAAERITVTEPAEGQVLREATPAYQVTPAGAPVEVLLDGAPLAAEPGQPIAPLAEGPHRLTVKAAGQDAPAQTVAFTVDTTPAAPAPGVNLAALELPPEGPLVLAWSEPLASLAATAGERAVPVELAADGREARLAPDPAWFGPEGALAVTLRAVDRAGNEAALAATLRRPAPARPPRVTIADGAPELSATQVPELKIVADRPVTWTVLLDGADVTARVRPAEPPPPPAAELVLPAALFEGLAPGPHELTVKAAAEGLPEGGASLRIVLAPPEPVAPVAPTPPVAAPAPPPAEAPWGSLAESYAGTIARRTGTLLDDMYLNDRGEFFEYFHFPEPPPDVAEDRLYLVLPRRPAGLERALEDPLFRRYSVEDEEGTPVPIKREPFQMGND